MKLLTTIVVALGVAVAGVNAAVDPGSVAACLLTCYISGAKTAGCTSPTDFNCICVTQNGPFFNAAATCISNSPGCNLNDGLNLRNELCKPPPNGGLIIAPPPAEKIDVTAFQAAQPCLYNCVIAAGNQVGCTSLSDPTCICNTQNNGPFLYAVFPCIQQNNCNINLGLTSLQQVCNYGVTNVPPEPSVGARRKRLERGLVAPRCPHLKKACKVAKRTHTNVLFGVQSREELNGDQGTTWECINVLSDLESCGGCAGEDGVDCTALEGVDEVSCRMGKCVVHSCAEGLSLVHGQCV
ncbi:hypothetical protein Q8F55_004790 [Vanrija albida]|uniref:CFEM domain-containing protein n=1 Tax=Vanrija albida TaxID=181172 RepID=A0ABR3PZT8_9TREE